MAEEVRTLAARSAQAAKQTTDLIEGSVRKVETGTKIANETAEVLVKIVSKISKAADLVEGIAKASDEQASSIEQINQGIQQVSQVVQNSAATSEESAAASEELSGQTAGLKENVSVFKVRGISRMSTLGTQPQSGSSALPGRKAPSVRPGLNPPKTISLGKSDFGKY